MMISHLVFLCVSVQLQESGMVPFIGAVLVALHDQTALQTALSLVADKLNNGLKYGTPQDRNFPLQRTRTEIWANNPPPQYQRLTVLSFQLSSLLSVSRIRKSFLHACTPERLHLSICWGKQHTLGDHTQHILQKKCWGT